MGVLRGGSPAAMKMLFPEDGRGPSLIRMPPTRLASPPRRRDPNAPRHFFGQQRRHTASAARPSIAGRRPSHRNPRGLGGVCRGRGPRRHQIPPPLLPWAIGPDRGTVLAHDPVDRQDPAMARDRRRRACMPNRCRRRSGLRRPASRCGRSAGWAKPASSPTARHRRSGLRSVDTMVRTIPST